MKLLSSFALVVGLAAGVLLISCNSKVEPTFLSTDITNANFGRDFRLTDHNGKIRSLDDFKGKAVVLFFGYTNCPDICPTTMGKLAIAMDKLGKDAKRVQVLFVSIDPEYDTPVLLKQYVTAFNPTFLGLSGEMQATRNIAKEFKIIIQKQVGRTQDNYTIDHSTGTYIFDVVGRLRLYVNSSMSADVFFHDILEILRTS
ncbi:MAG: SCO family protein [Betaproteobacteria bacterium]|nr:MAG: SCO family protein [Betaproteobacteria bacterium]TDI81577.1 MAG: SCO family protein [Betaproteobacteria bacterium]